MHLYRSHNCNELRKKDDGEAVKLSGWVHRIRDHGGVLFIDLRDHFGLTQVLADPDSPVFKDVESVRAEWCVSIEGIVRKRDESLIAGFSFDYNNTRLDASVKKRLEKMKKELKKTN